MFVLSDMARCGAKFKFSMKTLFRLKPFKLNASEDQSNRTQEIDSALLKMYVFQVPFALKFNKK